MAFGKMCARRLMLVVLAVACAYGASVATREAVDIASHATGSFGIG